MAKLADALDSGSSRGNPVEVQLLLAAKNSAKKMNVKRALHLEFSAFFRVGGRRRLCQTIL